MDNEMENQGPFEGVMGYTRLQRIVLQRWRHTENQMENGTDSRITWRSFGNLKNLGKF